MRVHRVLVVCSGNTCRSPMAAALLQSLWAEAAPGWDLAVESAGTGAFPGHGAAEHAIAVIGKRGIDLSKHRSRTVSDEVLTDVDLVLTMTARHKDYILTLWPELAGKIFSLGEYTGTHQDVPDPFGGMASQYEETAGRLERMLRTVVERMIREGRSAGMKIAVGCDHGGLELKQIAVATLQGMGHQVVDMGTHDTNSCDYPDFAQKVAHAVATGECQQGVLICGTGIGMSMAANKVKGIRAALCNEVFSARMARAHNDANILCMGARVVGPGVAQEIIHAYFGSDFEGGRHVRRVEKISFLDSRS